MSYQVPMFQDPETGELMPEAVLKMTAGRFHNEGGKFGFDGIEVSVYKDVDSSKVNRSRIKLDASQLLALAPPTKNEKDEDVPPVTSLSDEALGRIKDAMLGQLYVEYGALGVFAEATKV